MERLHEESFTLLQHKWQAGLEFGIQRGRELVDEALHRLPLLGGDGRGHHRGEVLLRGEHLSSERPLHFFPYVFRHFGHRGGRVLLQLVGRLGEFLELLYRVFTGIWRTNLTGTLQIQVSLPTWGTNESQGLLSTGSQCHGHHADFFSTTQYT